jgi:hypothetical protein
MRGTQVAKSSAEEKAVQDGILIKERLDRFIDLFAIISKSERKGHVIRRRLLERRLVDGGRSRKTGVFYRAHTIR